MRDARTVYGLGIVVREITEQHKLDQMKNTLISVVAHEMKTPLASIRMQAETLSRKDVTWDEATRGELIAGLIEDVERLAVLVRDWLDVSRLEAGTLQLDKSDFRLDELIDTAVRIAATNAHVTVLAPPITVRADRERILQILINLLVNALRYCDRKPQVTIRVQKERATVRVDVSDNGIGIAPQNLERIFEKFHQVDMSLSRRSGGTGLGLTISRGLARAHGGDLVVSSSTPAGSTFTLTLPLQQ